MGLLSRAGRRRLEKTALEPSPSSRPPADGRGVHPGEPLDEMGKALRERLGRLPQKKSTPYTALSLLKAYGAFQAGFCLSLKGGSYSSYASVGMGIETLSMPQEALWSEARAGDKYFRLDSAESFGTKNAKKDLVYWAFPLDTPVHSAKSAAAEPWSAVLILGAFGASGFAPEPVSAILDDVADKMVLPADQKAAEADSSETAPGFGQLEPFDGDKPEAFGSEIGSAIEKEIMLFYQIYLDFGCVVLENPAAGPGRSFDEQAGFCEKVAAIIDRAGVVIALPSGRPLILFSIEVDRELIAHRLSKTLRTSILLSFEAKNPETALIRIESLM